MHLAACSDILSCLIFFSLEKLATLLTLLSDLDQSEKNTKRDERKMDCGSVK